MGILCLAHFVVDLSCALLVASFSGQNLVFGLLLYNFCAFALELPLGILCTKSRWLPSLGLVLVFLAWAFPTAWVALIIAGIGNALFHLGGGLQVMEQTNTATPLGLFIAPGALGIYFGSFVGATWVLPVILLGCILLYFLWKNPGIGQNTQPQFQSSPKVSWTVLALLILVVLRGFSGVCLDFPWKAQAGGAFVTMVVLGKILGGILADRFGIMITGLVSLAIATLCLFGGNNQYLGLLGILAFQMTMPLTLLLLSRYLPHGLAFGLLTFGLFLGSLPVLLSLHWTVPLPGLILVSLLLFATAVRKEPVP